MTSSSSTIEQNQLMVSGNALYNGMNGQEREPDFTDKHGRLKRRGFSFLALSLHYEREKSVPMARNEGPCVANSPEV